VKGKPYLKSESFAALVQAIQAADDAKIEAAVKTIARDALAAKRKPSTSRKPAKDSKHVNSAGATDFTLAGKAYFPDAAGVWTVPSDPANFYAVTDAESAPLAYDPVFRVSVESVTLANDAETRLKVLELAHFGQFNTFGQMPLIDSAGVRQLLTAGECRALAIEYRMRLNASL
jgi:hypothetical protein